MVPVVGRRRVWPWSHGVGDVFLGGDASRFSFISISFRFSDIAVSSLIVSVY